MLENQNIQDFSIHNWYNKFKNICLETYIFEVPNEILLQIQSDECDLDIEKICNTEFVNGIKNAINSLDKSAFIKNNWHAPTDAKMFSIGNELKVMNLNDLSLFLSTSTRILDDFTTYKNTKFYLSLKPWKNIHPASEFRCIVINNVLRGITPRDWPTFYGHFKDEGSQIINTLKEFFENNIKNNFSKKHFTFDVVLNYPDQPYILDFGPLNNKSNLYAFSWKEIFPLMDKDVTSDIAPVFRYLETDIGIMSREESLRKFANSWPS